MSAQIKEALDDVAWLRKNYEFDSEDEQEAFTRIRTALVSAQREAEAWEEIEVARLKLGVTYLLTSFRSNSSKHLIRLHRGNVEVFTFLGLDRLEALEAAAKWCRAEMAAK